MKGKNEYMSKEAKFSLVYSLTPVLRIVLAILALLIAADSAFCQDAMAGL